MKKQEDREEDEGSKNWQLAGSTTSAAETLRGAWKHR